MAKSFLLILKFSMVLLGLGWVSIWLLKPTQLWTTKWKGAEDSARTTVFGYNGLDFVVYTFPIIALVMIGFIYLHFKQKEQRSRQGRNPMIALSNPIVVNSFIGVLSSMEILAVSLFILFLAWTFYTHISNDFNKMIPVKSFKLNIWQYKMFKMVTRCGLLAEACLALLLFPVLRGTAIFRLLGIQFEASVRYHIWLGTMMILFATLHGAGTFFIWGIKHRIQDEMWKWQKTGRVYLAGEIGLVTGLAIWITSLPQMRRKRFELFYYTHHLYIIFIVFFLFHTGDRHFYMVFPAIFLFGIERLLRSIQSRPETCILSARIFPSKAIELTLPKEPSLKYTPTSIIFMKIPSISKFQWHSFTIASSCNVDDDTMSVIIKCGGNWTNSLYDIIQAKAAYAPDRREQRYIPISIEGPYGPTSMDFLSKYDSLLLVAGGIGVTPFLSILKEISYAQSNGKKNFPSRIQLVYTVKKCLSIGILDSVLPLLTNKNTKEFHFRLKIFVTQESQSGTTISELMSEFSQVETVKFDALSTSYSPNGQESSLLMVAIVGSSSILFLCFLIVFSHVFLPQPKKPFSKEKTPSLSTDLLLLCSFSLSIITSTIVALILRLRRLRKQLPPVTSKYKRKEVDLSSLQPNRNLDEHEVHFGARPNFQDIFSKFPEEIGGSWTGVLVCGPETMKESVASLCQLSSQGLLMGAQRKKPYFNFHSLNFTL